VVAAAATVRFARAGGGRKHLEPQPA
jgi:hypothetical protein